MANTSKNTAAKKAATPAAKKAATPAAKKAATPAAKKVATPAVKKPARPLVNKQAAKKVVKPAAENHASEVLAPHEIVKLVDAALQSDPKACMDLMPGVPFTDLQGGLVARITYGTIKIGQLPA